MPHNPHPDELKHLRHVFSVPEVEAAYQAYQYALADMMEADEEGNRTAEHEERVEARYQELVVRYEAAMQPIRQARSAASLN